MQGVQTDLVVAFPEDNTYCLLPLQDSGNDRDIERPVSGTSRDAACQRQLASAVATAEVLGTQLQQALQQTAEAPSAHEACRAEMAAWKARVLADQAAIREPADAEQAQSQQEQTCCQHDLAACQWELAQCRQQLLSSRLCTSAAEEAAAAAQQQMHACQAAGSELYVRVQQLEASYGAACRTLQACRLEIVEGSDCLGKWSAPDDLASRCVLTAAIEGANCLTACQTFS